MSTELRENSVIDKTSRIKKIVAGLALAGLLAIFAMPAFAVAQAPTDDQYDKTTTRIIDLTDQDGLDGQVGPLPFTGFDVVAMLAVALAVTGLGLALQRAVSRQATDSE
jgi:hypothetical protein